MNLEEEGITGFILTTNNAVRDNIMKCHRTNRDNSITFVFNEALYPNKESIPLKYKRSSIIIKLSNTCIRACLDTVISHSHNRSRSPTRKGGRSRYKPAQKKLKSITYRKRR